MEAQKEDIAWAFTIEAAKLESDGRLREPEDDFPKVEIFEGFPEPEPDAETPACAACKARASREGRLQAAADTAAMKVRLIKQNAELAAAKKAAAAAKKKAAQQEARRKSDCARKKAKRDDQREAMGDAAYKEMVNTKRKKDREAQVCREVLRERKANDPAAQHRGQ